MRLPFNLEVKAGSPSREQVDSSTSIQGTKVVNLVAPWQTGREAYTKVPPEVLLQNYQGYTYVCSSKNAQAVASVPLRLYTSKKNSNSKALFRTKKVTGRRRKFLEGKANLRKYITKGVDIEEVEDHPYLTLMQNVNAFNNRFDTWELTQLFQELVGNAYWYVIRDNLGTPVQLWVLPAHKVRIVPSRQNWIHGYVVTIGSEKIPFEPHEIIHFKFPNPSDPFYGYSPLEAVRISVSLNAKYDVFENALLANNARPEGVVSTEQSLNEKEYDRLKGEWAEKYGGANKVGKTVLLEKGLKYTPITMTPRDLMFKQGREETTRQIANAYGVPMSKLTTADVNRSNADSGERQYQKDAIQPRLTRNEEKLNEQLLPLFDDSLFVAYDNPVPEDKEFNLKERETDLGTGMTTINEERAKRMLEPVEWGDIPILSSTMVPLGSNVLSDNPDDNPKPNDKPKPDEEEEEESKIATSIMNQMSEEMRKHF